MDKYEKVEQLIKKRSNINKSLKLLKKNLPIRINVVNTEPISAPKNCRIILIQALESELKEVEERLNDYLT